MKLMTHYVSGLALTDHIFEVPLDHAQPNGAKIEVFAREVVASRKVSQALPWLVFFQGGPGSPAPRPTGSSGWLKRALQDYRVLLLDQRGTGRSTPVTAQTLAHLPPQAMADYLKYFRADAIVADAEHIRRELLGPDEKWSVLGQSYGGFIITHYLSVAASALRQAIITGGLPPLTRHADEVYRATYKRVIGKNARYYQRYPDDIERVRDIMRHLHMREVQLPAGGVLSPRRFQQLGLMLGAGDGFEAMHYLLENAFVGGANGRVLSHNFLRAVENEQHYETNPIFAILHEAIYCQGHASRWSAQRVRDEYPEFTPDVTARGEQPVYFTGEMIYPWQFDDYAGLRPLKEAAHILADYDGWPMLYRPEVLQTNTVPCVAAVYYDDMYVEREFSEETARTIRGLKMWVTSEYEHNGLRADGETVLGHLLEMENKD